MIFSEKPTVCPICFENFKSPRYLPCLHTFCYDCLLSYIVTACKQKEAPVGFQCPLCRIFVPVPVFPALPEKWAELIPVNKTIQALVAKGDDIKFCDACKRGNEEEIASDWCETCMEALCGICTKCHKKSLASSQHRIIPIRSLKENVHVDRSETREYCSIHQEKIKYFCDDHHEACCMHCECTVHRTCTQVVTVEKQAHDLLKTQKISKIIKQIKQYIEALEKVKTDGKNNMAEIDKASDDMIKQSTELKTELMTQIEILFEKHLNEISRVTKECRKKLTESVEGFSDRKLLGDSYVKTLESIKESGSSIALVIEYYKIKKHIFKVAESEVPQIEFHVKQDFQQKLCEILKLSTFANLTLGEQLKNFHFDMNILNQTSLYLICELDYSQGEITGGCFLPDGDVLLVDTQSKQIAYHNSTGKFLKYFSLRFFPDDLTLVDPNSHDFFITCSWGSARGIHSVSLSADKTKLMENLNFKCHNKDSKCFGITCRSGFIYVACGTFILKMDTVGNVISNLKTEEKTHSVALNRNNHIISSSCSSHSVTSMNEIGERFFRYTHPDLKYPYGLDVDYEGYIYVCGRDSNNIYVLLPSGELLQILKTSKPNCIKFKKDSRVCFIGSYKSCSTKICEFRESES
ncbi:E3 ubiquitin-protein ligase Midline-1-like [Saccostrea echinata]|uniref:E3 ubiquitin-protein ligase Midline-1-like n=1 Tax=Saccostrea echinata TaxID=191078 RepID=UPI002A8125A7|nr:E3 ubiquitin-protein ligase Midline-1-like [Saccostrea echinata]